MKTLCTNNSALLYLALTSTPTVGSTAIMLSYEYLGLHPVLSDTVFFASVALIFAGLTAAVVKLSVLRRTGHRALARSRGRLVGWSIAVNFLLSFAIHLYVFAV